MNKITVEQLLASDWPMSLAKSANGEDEPFDGSCPCGIIYGEGFQVEVHCWRSNCDCPYSGVHVSGTISKSVKKKIAEHVRDNNGWSKSTDWNIVIE